MKKLTLLNNISMAFTVGIFYFVFPNEIEKMI